MRWTFAWTGVTTSKCNVNWIIVKVQDGNSANTISQSNGADMYTPENNVMAFGTISLMNNDETGGNMNWNESGSTKTMRKMQQGDLLQFITFTDVVNGAQVRGVVQFFCKS